MHGHVALNSLRNFALAVLAVWLCLGPGSRPSAALDIEFQGRPVKLDILALYDSRRERAPHLTRIHKFAEMPLNHLGFRVIYQDVNARLPSFQSLTRYRGVLTWFVEPLQRPDQVVGWLEQAVGRGLRYVVLGEPVPPSGEALRDRVNRLLARIGLEDRGDYVDLVWRARVVEQDSEVIGFERPVDKVLPSFPVMAQKGGQIDAHLVLEGPSGTQRVQSTVVATSAGGGFAATNHVVAFEPNTNRVRWIVNPFQFFGRAFGDERRPIPDTTTLAGRRIYFSHVDGDGWNNVSQIQGHREVRRYSAEVIEREAIVPYPDLPVTVGLIGGDVDQDLGGLPQNAQIARRIFALPQVEVATHSYTHPFNWQFFESYDRGEELKRVEEVQSPTLPLRERLSRRVVEISGRQQDRDLTGKYIAGSDDLPRTFLKRPFDIDVETTGALKASTVLAPPDKPARVYLWSGDTTPFPAAIAAVRRAGARNINGGDSRLDAEYPSVAYVPPIARAAGDERQIYAGNSNENTYTNDWTGPYYGFMMLEKTLANTESPRRLKPFNIYYHMYSGERPSALAAVRAMLDLARRSPVIPITTSHYAAIADDFFGVDIVQVDLFSWAVSRRGTLSTMRFEDADQLALDLARSTGVLGATRHEGDLYVALDPVVERAVITLRQAQDAGPRRLVAALPTRIASLVSSRWQIDTLNRNGCGFSFRAQGFGTGDMVWRTSPGRGYRVTTHRDGRTLAEETRWADADGRFELRIQASAISPVEIRFDCHD